MTNFDQVIKAIKDLDQLPNIKELVDNEDGIETICSSSPVFFNNVDDDTVNRLIEVEHSVAYYVFDETGIVKKDAIKKLRQNGLELTNLDENLAPFTHGVKTPNFHILISF